jgi:hypothetical protein
MGVKLSAVLLILLLAVGRTLQFCGAHSSALGVCPAAVVEV